MRPLTRQGERLYNFWVLVKPAEDVPGQWLAHCLEVDVVTQGDSIKHVLDMISEAVPMVVEEDLSTGRDPHERRAPKEYWNELYQLLNDSEPTDLARVMEHDPS
jgi:predicted RNase H-like HicB family nuclease